MTVYQDLFAVRERVSNKPDRCREVLTDIVLGDVLRADDHVLDPRVAVVPAGVRRVVCKHLQDAGDP